MCGVGGGEQHLARPNDLVIDVEQVRLGKHARSGHGHDDVQSVAVGEELDDAVADLGVRDEIWTDQHDQDGAVHWWSELW